MSRAKTEDAPVGGAQRWDVTWTDVEQAQLETALAATPAQRLAWLEEAMRLAYASGALGTDRGQNDGPDRSVSLIPPRSTRTRNRPSEKGGEASQEP